MAKPKEPTESITTKQVKALTKTLSQLPPEPVDCNALLNLIEVAQRLYAQHCPIL